MLELFGFTIVLPPSLLFLDSPLGEFVATALAWVVIAVLAYVLLTYVLRWLTHQLPGEVDDIVLGIVRRPLLILLIAFGIINSLRVLDLPAPFTEWVERILISAEIIIGAYVVWRIVHEVVLYYGMQWAVRTENRLDDIVIPLVNLLGAVVIVLVTLLMVLSVFGIDVSSILVGAGVIGLVLGLALQDTLGNVFSGISLIADTPFRTGDLITLSGDKIYLVEKIGLRTTTLYSYDDHSTTYIPNRVLTDQPIENITKPTVELRLAIEIGVAYASDLPKVERVLKEIAWAHPNVLGSDLTRKQASVRAEIARLRAAGQGDAAAQFERGLVKMEREHALFERVREFDAVLADLALAIDAREERGLTADEVRELNSGYVAPANVLMEQVSAALNAWRTVPDPWANIEELDVENQRWQIRRERLERRWVSVRDSVLNPAIEHTGRLDNFTQELRTWMRQEFKFPPEIWKDPSVNFLSFNASSVDVRLAYFIDDGRLEHFKRKTRLTRELGFTIHRRFQDEGIEIAFPQLDVWLRNQAAAK